MFEKMSCFICLSQYVFQRWCFTLRLIARFVIAEKIIKTHPIKTKTRLIHRKTIQQNHPKTRVKNQTQTNAKKAAT